MNSHPQENKARKRTSLKSSHPFTDQNELMKLQKKRNSVNWLLPDHSSFQFKEIKTSFQDIENNSKGSSTENTKESRENNEVFHLKFKENRRRSIKNEFQIAKELLKKQSEEIKEELEENEVIEKNSELNKKIGKEAGADDDDEDDKMSNSSNSN